MTLILRKCLMLVTLAACVLGVAVLQQAATAGPMSIPSPAAAPPAATEVATVLPPQTDPLGRTTPKGMIQGFLKAVENEDYIRAAEYLDLSALPARQRNNGPDLARDLQTLLDQGGWIQSASKLSDLPEGIVNDDLPLNVDVVATVRSQGKPIDLLAERISDASGNFIWKFSRKTVGQIPDLLENMATGPLDRILPELLIENKLYGVPYGHWLAIFTIALISLLTTWGLTYGVIAFIRRLWTASRTGQARMVLDAFVWPIRIYIALGIFVVLARASGISIVARQNFTLMAEIAAWLSLWWFLWRIIDIVASNVQQRLDRETRRSALSSVIFFRRSARLVLSAIAISLAMERGGVNVSGWFAALGIGGLALAFGAQKTVENFVVGLTLIIDQPMRIGDFCKIGTLMGTVEEIGMRSTRLKTQDQTLLTIPNGQLATQSIENYALRSRFWFRHTLGLRYETTQGQLRQLLEKIRHYLLNHPLVDKDNARARFREFAAYSLNIEVHAFVVAESFEDFLKTQEDMLFKLMAIMEECGAGFAFPSQTLYFTNDAPLGNHDPVITGASQSVTKEP